MIKVLMQSPFKNMRESNRYYKYTDPHKFIENDHYFRIVLMSLFLPYLTREM